VPEFRPLALSLCKMHLYFGAPRLRERPGKRSHREIERRDAVDDGRGHAVSRNGLSGKILLRIRARRLLRGIDELVGPGLADIDIGPGDFGRTDAEYRKHGV